MQDLGRFGLARHGVSRTGAADDLALRMGNALLGNAPTAAGLEVPAAGGLLSTGLASSWAPAGMAFLGSTVRWD